MPGSGRPRPNARVGVGGIRSRGCDIDHATGRNRRQRGLKSCSAWQPGPPRGAVILDELGPKFTLGDACQLALALQIVESLRTARPWSRSLGVDSTSRRAVQRGRQFADCLLARRCEPPVLAGGQLASRPRPRSSPAVATPRRLTEPGPALRPGRGPWIARSRRVPFPVKATRSRAASRLFTARSHRSRASTYLPRALRFNRRTWYSGGVGVATNGRR